MTKHISFAFFCLSRFIKPKVLSFIKLLTFTRFLMKKILFPILFVILGGFIVSAQTGTKRPAIVESIESTSNVVVKQAPELDELIDDYIKRKDSSSSGPYVGPGFRVQVFSSNAQRTAKDESLSIERRLRSAFPGYGVYRIYSSPFWKVRIGDFKTSADALSFRAELIKAFPELRKETYTVRESRVSVR